MARYTVIQTDTADTQFFYGKKNGAVVTQISNQDVQIRVQSSTDPTWQTNSAISDVIGGQNNWINLGGTEDTDSTGPHLSQTGNVGIVTIPGAANGVEYRMAVNSQDSAGWLMVQH